MIINSPLSSISEVVGLVKAGADEFYCGVCVSKALNDRPNSGRFNLADLKELKDVVGLAHSLGKKINLVINKPALDIDSGLKLARVASKLGVDSLVVSNLYLYDRLVRMGYPVHLSCIHPVLNSSSFDILSERPKRVCLPRHLSVDEIAKISKKGIALEVFVLNGMCINIEGFCNLHDMDVKFDFCKKFDPCDGGFCNRFYMINRNLSSPRYSCGVCGLYDLRESVVSLKIEGRGRSFDKKVANVKMVKACVEKLKSNISRDEYYSFCERKFYECKGRKCKKEYCYY